MREYPRYKPTCAYSSKARAATCQNNNPAPRTPSDLETETKQGRPFPFYTPLSNDHRPIRTDALIQTHVPTPAPTPTQLLYVHRVQRLVRVAVLGLVVAQLGQQARRKRHAVHRLGRGRIAPVFTVRPRGVVPTTAVSTVPPVPLVVAALSIPAPVPLPVSIPIPAVIPIPVPIPVSIPISIPVPVPISVPVPIPIPVTAVVPVP